MICTLALGIGDKIVFLLSWEREDVRPRLTGRLDGFGFWRGGGSFGVGNVFVIVYNGFFLILCTSLFMCFVIFFVWGEIEGTASGFIRDDDIDGNEIFCRGEDVLWSSTR